MQINSNTYSQKIHYFLTTKYFLTLRKDLTTVHQHKYKKHCQQNNILISKHRIKHLTQFSPTLPKLKANLKIHKDDIPIRPMANNINALAYKLAKFLRNSRNDMLNLPNSYNIPNSTTLANNF
jgi:hypothetical protein